jgi:hypothetical protein
MRTAVRSDGEVRQRVDNDLLVANELEFNQFVRRSKRNQKGSIPKSISTSVRRRAASVADKNETEKSSTFLVGSVRIDFSGICCNYRRGKC